MPNVPQNVVYQGLLLKQLKNIFQNEEFHENIRSLQLSGFEVDIWLPKYNLSFEFQDSYHYVATWDHHNTRETVTTKDRIKNVIVRQREITLIEVPCWWDGTVASLMSSIHFHRPDLLTCSPVEEEISLNPPTHFFKSTEIPSVGEFMLASFLPNSRTLAIDDTWWVGEKYDGIRCCWDPMSKNCYGRYSQRLYLLPSLTRLLPPIFLDTEIWFGRGLFNYAYTIYKYDEKGHWDFLRVISFDVPSKALHTQPFEYRYRILVSNIYVDDAFTVSAFIPSPLIAPRMLCINEPSLRGHVQTILDNSGEGVILQKVNSTYDFGRTSSLIKLKAYVNDQEGLVVAISDDNFISVKLPDGRIFAVPPQDVFIPLPSVGDVVTFSCDQFSRKEMPDSPKIIRVRPDILWEDVILNAVAEKRKLNSQSLVFATNYTVKPLGYWNIKNMRSFMEDFARKKNLDPHLASTWYTITAKEIDKTKGGRTVLLKLKGYFNALRILFPAIKFDPSMFVQGSWNSMESKRQFFENYAKANGFDPLEPSHWYNQPFRKFAAFKGGHAITKNTQFHKVLMGIFPNIGLEISKFPRQTQFQWRENRVKFFEKYAIDNGFDPSDAKSWYLQSRAKILSVKGATSVVDYYGCNVKTALMELFPLIGLKRESFVPFSWPYRKKYMLQYAHEHCFEALVAENWYSQTRESLLTTLKEVASSILAYHSNSFATTLQQLFPNIGLEPSKLAHLDTHKV